MRRWLGRLAAGVLLAMTAPGCDHWAGVCDCDCNNYHGCCYGLGGYHGVMGEHAFGNAPIVGGPIAGPEVQTAPAPKPVPDAPKPGVPKL